MLGSDGGGRIATAPGDGEGRTAMETVFLFELSFDEAPPPNAIGLRAHVRFAHAHEPAAHQLYRSGRQLFLSRFGI